MWKSWERIGIERYINYLSNEGSLSIGGLLVKQSDSSKNLSLQPPLLPPSRLLGQDVCCDQQGAAGIYRGWRIFPGTVLYCTVLCSKVLYCTVQYYTVLYGILLTKQDCVRLYIKHHICLKIYFFLLKSVLSPQICVLLRKKNILCTKINFA